ncbi:hypothetical protein WJX72_004463 [[Myrmecia] bisecta]|uniref:Uncharacterized protein n=1 Tax=[Myrmecia] bisecta TaxID=41462 RepID=A0AAW1Q775_9CHLO
MEDPFNPKECGSGRVRKRYTKLSLYSYVAFMGFMVCTGAMSALGFNCVLSILSGNAVGSVLSVNSVFSVLSGLNAMVKAKTQI